MENDAILHANYHINSDYRCRYRVLKHSGLCGNSKTPNHIVVFPVWAEEILLELVDTDCIVWVGHPYLEEAETYWPTMKDTKEICGSIWQETDDSEILKLSPDLIICPDELSGDYDAIFRTCLRPKYPLCL